MKRPSFGAAVFFGACQNHGVNDSGIDAWLLAQGERMLVRLHAAAPFDVAAQAPLRRLAIASDFAIATLTRQPDLLPALLHDSASARPSPLLSADNRSEWQTLLRRYRSAESTRLVWRDVLGLDDVDATLAGTTALAEQCLRIALEALEDEFARRHGVLRGADGKVQRLVVFGLGKLGGGELNFSSDVDLVYGYEHAGGVASDSDGPRPLAAED